MIMKLSSEPPRFMPMWTVCHGNPLPVQENGECLSKVSVFNVAQINIMSVSVTDL